MTVTQVRRGYEARTGYLNSVGKTKTEARGKLMKQLEYLAEYYLTHRYVLCKDGTLLVMYPVPATWAYNIIKPSSE